MQDKRVIRVTCAIIEKDGNILAAQRSEIMSLPLKWEFPGGKVENGENPEACIKREIREELDGDISIVTSLRDYTREYDDRIFVLMPFICKIVSGNITCREHKSIRWGKPQDLKDLDWAEADEWIYKQYIDYINNEGSFANLNVKN